MINGTHTKSTKQTTFNDDHEDDDDSNNSYSPDLMSILLLSFSWSIHYTATWKMFLRVVEVYHTLFI